MDVMSELSLNLIYVIGDFIKRFWSNRTKKNSKTNGHQPIAHPLKNPSQILADFLKEIFSVQKKKIFLSLFCFVSYQFSLGNCFAFVVHSFFSHSVIISVWWGEKNVIFSPFFVPNKRTFFPVMGKKQKRKRLRENWL